MEKKKIITLLSLGLIFLLIIFIPGYLKIRRLSRENRQLEKQIEQMQELNAKLREEQRGLMNDPLYLEKVAREKLGVVKKGEVVYKVLPQEEE